MLSKTAKELDTKVISLVKAINIVMDISILKAKLYPRFVPEFDKNYKDAKIKVRRLKKI